MTHQLVSPPIAAHCDSSTSETLKAPVMNPHIHDAMF